tara:strand:+ start:2106 stop:2540 length:435 start_codon:yes stop_codon:yes gene_type:complete
VITPPLNEQTLRELFTKPYGSTPPTDEQWKAVYADAVKFVDPTQEKIGVDQYIQAQEGLLRRCDDVYLETEHIAIQGNVAFIEWRMGLKIKGIEFLYPGATRLIFGDDGKITHHRDYFDFVAPTFAPVPVIGNIVNWLYKRFVS